MSRRGLVAAAGSDAEGIMTDWRRLAACLLLSIQVAAGCGRRPAPAADPARDAALLESVLAAWREGAACGDLRNRAAPVHVADERWLGGARLESFSIGGPRPSGSSTRFEVTLVGPPPLGTRTVVYQVSTQPAASVTLVD
jgi:hypothetical protein